MGDWLLRARVEGFDGGAPAATSTQCEGYRELTRASHSRGRSEVSDLLLMAPLQSKFNMDAKTSFFGGGGEAPLVFDCVTGARPVGA